MMNQFLKYLFLGLAFVLPGNAEAQNKKWAVGVNHAFWKDKNITSLNTIYTGWGGGVFFDAGIVSGASIYNDENTNTTGGGPAIDALYIKDYPDVPQGYYATSIRSNIKGYNFRFGGYIIWAIVIPRLSPVVHVDISYLSVKDNFTTTFTSDYGTGPDTIDDDGSYDFWALSFGLRPGVQYHFSKQIFASADMGLVFYMPRHTVIGSVPETAFQPKYGPHSPFERGVLEVKVGLGVRF